MPTGRHRSSIGPTSISTGGRTASPAYACSSAARSSRSCRCSAEKDATSPARHSRVARRVGDPESTVVALSRVALAATALGEPDGQALLHEAFEEAWRARVPHEMTRSRSEPAAPLAHRLPARGRRRVRRARARSVDGSGNRSVVPCRSRGAVRAERSSTWASGIGPMICSPVFACRTRPGCARTSQSRSPSSRASAHGDAVLTRRMLAEAAIRSRVRSRASTRRSRGRRALADGEPHVARTVVDEMLPLAESIPDSSHRGCRRSRSGRSTPATTRAASV